MGTTMWMVRAGQGSEVADDFKSSSCVAIGWDRLTDMSSVTDKKEIRKKVAEAWPEFKEGRVWNATGQFGRFLLDFKVGDRIMTYDGDRRVYLIGHITGEYEYKPELIKTYPHVRKVKWETPVDRDRLSTQARNTLGSALTLFKVNPGVVAEIDSLLAGKPGKGTGEGVKEDVEALRKDAESRGRSFIEDRVTKLDWEEMQELVAGILRAMGYKTRVSSEGPDRGVDILASPDGLGLSQPRIIVEVKHRPKEKADAPMIRSFLGGRRPGDNGMYVSTGGFAKDARYEAERANIPLTLIALEDLVNLLIQHYENLDAETRAIVPLVPIYWPAS